MDEKKILEKAKKTRYKHKDWYRGTNKSVYEVIGEMVKSNDFRIDIPRTFYSVPASQLRNMGYGGDLTTSSFIDWLIKNEYYNQLVIRYSGSEGGADKGKLKVQTFLILKKMDR